jgi:hypothetical protein
MTPLRFLGSRVLQMRVGEWTEVYARVASRPACFVITVEDEFVLDEGGERYAHSHCHRDGLG